MYCKNCGTKLDDNSKFCYVCGTAVTAKTPAASTSQPRYARPAALKKAPKKKKALVTIVAIVAVVAILAVGVSALIFSGVFGSDSVKVAAAMTKSGKAFTDATDKMALTDVSSIIKSKKLNQEYALWIDEIDGNSSLSGLGVRLALDSDLPGRNICMAATPFWGSADLITVQTKLYDAEIYLGSPELTGGNFYMINTETIFSDLENMGADLGEAADFSINLFDIIEKIQELGADSQDLTKAVKEAATTLLQNVEVTKSGSETMDINGSDLNCTIYDVMIPESAIHTFLYDLEAAYQDVYDPYACSRMLETVGMPAEVIEEMEDILTDSTYAVEEAFSEIHYTIEELGDINLNLYLNDGYVVALTYENTFDYVDLSVIIRIGGGSNYVDDISIQVIVDDEEYRITSTGNHAGTNNVFSDETLLEYVYNGSTATLLQLKSSFAPKQVEDNFSFKMSVDESALELRGQLTCDKDFMDLYLDKIAISEYGEDLAVVGIEFSIGKYKGDSFSVNNYQALANMTEQELMDAAEELTNNASEWATNLDSDIQNKLMAFAYNYF